MRADGQNSLSRAADIVQQMRMAMCSVKTCVQRRERGYDCSLQRQCAADVAEVDARERLRCMASWFQSARMVRMAGVGIMGPLRCGLLVPGWRGVDD